MAIQDTIISLFAKAGDAGATDAERAGAMAQAEKLMKKYGLSETDLAIGQRAAVRDFRIAKFPYSKSLKTGRTYRHPVDRFMGNAIGRFTDTMYFVNGSQEESWYIGFEKDIDIAEWLRSAMIQQFDRDWKLYKLRDRTNKSVLNVGEQLKSFAIGWTDANNSRIREWCEAREAAAVHHCGPSDSTSLVTHKISEIERFIREELKMHVTTTYATQVNASNTEAAGAGTMAGAASKVTSDMAERSTTPQLADRRASGGL